MAPANTTRRSQTILDALASMALILAASTLIWTSIRPSSSPRTPDRAIPVPAEPIPYATAPVKGSVTAPLGLIVYSDFECPFCGMFAQDTLPDLDARYIRTGLLQFAFKHLPLPNHTLAPTAAALTVCAERQGDFWPVHDMLFATHVARERITLADRLAGVSDPALLDCRGSEEAAQLVAADATEAQRLGISSTPVFLLGVTLPNRLLAVKHTIRGAQPIEEFTRLIDSLLGTVSHR